MLILVGASCSSSSSNAKILYYQMLMYLIPLDASILSWVIKLLMTTGLFIYINKCKLIISSNTTFLVVNYLLVVYYSVFLVTYYNSYSVMLQMYDYRIDMYLEYLVLILLIDYKDLIINARNFNNKFKYNMLNSYRSISLSNMEVKEDKRWN